MTAAFTIKDADPPEVGDTSGAAFECYMPNLQFVVRLLFIALAGIYFLFLPEPLVLFSQAGIIFTLLVFFFFHVGWWYLYKSRGMGDWGIRLATYFDIIGALMAVLNDPFQTPPAGAFLLVAVLGNGMQHGFRLLQEQLVLVAVFLFPVLAVRQLILGTLPYSLVFVVIFLTACLFYAYLLLQRIELLKQAAENMADQDPLTRIYNRNAFVRTSKSLLALGQRQQMPLALMFADLDDFKKVNDTLGHAVGDEVLICFARLAEKRLRKSDIIARFGGDEFVFILADMAAEGAALVAGRLQREFLQWAEGRNIHVGVSFGIMTVPHERAGQNPTLDDLLRQVDKALYQAKNDKGTSRIVIAPPL